MPKSKILKRIITCQGSLQLITALSVVLCRTQEQESQNINDQKFIYQDYLVIYDVSPDFAAFIEQVIASVWSWQKITYLQKDSITYLNKQLISWNSPNQLTNHQSLQKLRTEIGVQIADEIYLVRNWQTSNQILLIAYETAIKIAYGDGIGYFFGSEKFTPKFKQYEALKVSLTFLIKNFISQSIGKLKTLPKVEFEQGYFLLPKIFQETPNMPYSVPERKFIDTIIQEIAQKKPTEFSLPLKQNQATVILLPGNFAPTWTTHQQEINAYIEVLREKFKPESVIILKPHPRRSGEEIKIFSKALQQYFTTIHVLETPVSYMPMEVLLWRKKDEKASITILGFTSACIALAFIYKINCIVGFGQQCLEKFFPKTKEHMQQNEIMLQKILEQILEGSLR